jgi:hypothetical protein
MNQKEREREVRCLTVRVGGGRNRHGSGEAVRGGGGAVSEARCDSPVVALPATSALPRSVGLGQSVGNSGGYDQPCV